MFDLQIDESMLLIGKVLVFWWVENQRQLVCGELPRSEETECVP